MDKTITVEDKKYEVEFTANKKGMILKDCPSAIFRLLDDGSGEHEERNLFSQDKVSAMANKKNGSLVFMDFIFENLEYKEGEEYSSIIINFCPTQSQDQMIFTMNSWLEDHIEAIKEAKHENTQSMKQSTDAVELDEFEELANGLGESLLEDGELGEAWEHDDIVEKTRAKNAQKREEAKQKQIEKEKKALANYRL